MNEIIQTLTLYALPVMFAITLHEAAHGYVARLFGDPTATLAGRVTLNPIKHVDPVGTIAVPIGILLMSKLVGGPFLLFGWAKPVPVDFGRLRRPKRDMLWVALAGPAANLFMAILWGISLRLLFETGDRGSFWFQMAQVGIQINLTLMALNLLPILPLDGGRMLFSLLPHQLAWQYSRIEPFGLWNKGGGKVLPGLVSRRAREAALFLKPASAPDAPWMPQRVEPSKEPLSRKVVATATAAAGTGATYVSTAGIPPPPDLLKTTAVNVGAWKGLATGADPLTLAGLAIVIGAVAWFAFDKWRAA